MPEAYNIINNILNSRRSAHVAGMSGKQTQLGKVNTIVGLDPAGIIKILAKVVV